MFANLLPVIKIAAPVGLVAGLGGSTYYVASQHLSRKSSSAVYLLVKGTTATSNSATGSLTETVDSKQKKQYFCTLTKGEKTSVKDETCALYKLSSEASVNSIEFKDGMFDDANLVSTANSVSASSYHILKISRDFYKNFVVESATAKNNVVLTSVKDKTKSFGTLNKVSEIDFSSKKDLTAPKVDLLLARVKSPTSASSTAITEELTCKLSDEIVLPCKVYKLSDSKETINSLTKELASKLAATTVADYKKDNYLVIDLWGKKQDLKTLKAKSFKIYKTKKPADFTSTNEVSELLFDQPLFGAVSSTLTSSKIFPVAANKAVFVGIKGSENTASSTTAITETTAKNYRCKYQKEASGEAYYDDSCQIFGITSSTANPIPLSTIKGTNTFADITFSSDTSPFYKLSLDLNKLPTLDPTLATPANIKIQLLPTTTGINATDGVIASIDLKHNITNETTLGSTDMLLGKVTTASQLTTDPSTTKCTLEGSSTAIACSIFKATPAAGGSTTPENITFTEQALSATETFTAGNYYAIKLTDAKRPLTDLKAASVTVEFVPTTGTASTVTFKTINLIGGEIASSKKQYYLESSNREA